MTKQELVVTCLYGTEDENIKDIISKSFLIYIKKELETGS